MNKLEAKTVDTFNTFLSLMDEADKKIDNSINGKQIDADIIENSKNKGVIGKIGGIGADSNEATRNGRRYPTELWKNVEQSEYFIEGMENRTIIGEADHPNERLDYSVKEGAVTLTKYEVQDTGKVYTEFDILDTIPGRIVKTYFDAGCRLGVSSRGLGEEVVVNGETIIDPDSYQFYCFDVVAFPAVKSARMELIESTTGKKEKLINSIIKEVKNCTTKNEVMFIESMSRGVDLYLDEIKEAVDIKLKTLEEVNINDVDDPESCRKAILAGINAIDKLGNNATENDLKLKDYFIKFINTDKSDVEKLLNELQKEYLNDNDSSLNQDDCDKNNKIKISGDNLNSDEDTTDDINDSDDNLQILNELENEVESLTKQLEQKNKIIQKLNATKYSNSKTINTQIETLNSLTIKQEQVNKRLANIVSTNQTLKKEINNINKKYENLHNVNGEFSNIISTLNEKMEKEFKNNKLLNNKISILENKNSNLIKLNSQLKESIKSEKFKSKQHLNESTNNFKLTINSLQTENKNLKNKTESMKKIIDDITCEKDKKAKAYIESLDKYISMVCNKYNLQESTLRRLLGDTYNASDIDKLAKELVENDSKIKSLPFNHLKPDRQIYTENIALSDDYHNDVENELEVFEFMLNRN